MLIGGVLLGGPGLLDPCEKEPVDAVSSLSVQQREDITRTAQVCTYIGLCNNAAISNATGFLDL